MIASKVAKGKEAEGAKYRDYFEWSEPFKTIPSHRMLAIRRGEKESFLIMRIEGPCSQCFSGIGFSHTALS